MSKIVRVFCCFLEQHKKWQHKTEEVDRESDWFYTICCDIGSRMQPLGYYVVVVLELTDVNSIVHDGKWQYNAHTGAYTQTQNFNSIIFK